MDDQQTNGSGRMPRFERLATDEVAPAIAATPAGADDAWSRYFADPPSAQALAIAAIGPQMAAAWLCGAGMALEAMEARDARR